MPNSENVFKPIRTRPDFPEMERETMRFWEERGIFRESLEARRGCREYVFYDGPPFATGLPHYGHLLAGAIKDVIPRYQTMRGRFVDRVFGWDCHGLPVEYEMEKTLELSGKKEIEEYGVDKFNEACRSIVLRYTGEWREIVTRMGRWVDFDRGYKTMDLDYMESIWWVFKTLWDKGLVYEGHRVLPYCPRCATPLSNFEANQGYAEVNDPAITLAFQDLENPSLSYWVWTTTPWTLPSNLALAVGADIDYVEVDTGNGRAVLAESRLAEYRTEDAPLNVVARVKGAELAGRRYRPLFPYFAELAEKGAFRIVTAAHVTTDDGTGIVHTAPGFGEDDAEAAREHGLPEVCPVNEECEFTSEVADYAGRRVKDADKDIIRRLKEDGVLVKRSTIKHNYPHCWRDDAPLIYRAVSTWFVDIGKIKDRMVAANRSVNWVPSHIRDGRFGKWLENARDWAISRNRYWGNPLPIWRNDTGETVCVGSVEELARLSGREITDIHKHFVDKIEIPSKNGGKPLRRVSEVLDCWFESGSMPYAQLHYPFENKERFEENFPADFIAEGLDQTRGWFYTLVVLGAALFDKPPFKNVVVNGLILAEDGQKMSKRKKNYPDPMVVFDSHGADALRLFLLSSPVVRGEDLKFSEDAITEALRSVMIPIWNAHGFLVTYANIDGWRPQDPPAPPVKPASPLDRWILSSLSAMVEEIREHMDEYHIREAANRFRKFIDDLTNWYIRRSRRRFWKGDDDEDKRDAYATLHYVLLTFCEVAAPFIPFLSEMIYRNLKTPSMSESVHLRDYPVPDASRRDTSLEKQMGLAITAVSLGRSLRAKRSLRTRQPLPSARIVVHDQESRSLVEEAAGIIAEELNVKEVIVDSDASELVDVSFKADFRKLGPKLGSEMKSAAGAIAAFDGDAIATLEKGGAVEIDLPSGKKFAVTADDVVACRSERQGLCVATENEVTIALDTRLTDELRNEGVAREFVNRLQNLRKDLGFEVSDRVCIFYRVEDDGVAGAVEAFSDYVKGETLADSLESVDSLKGEGSNVDIDGVVIAVSIEKTRP
jgi:isoleucyl-tRNA synthetase